MLLHYKFTFELSFDIGDGGYSLIHAKALKLNPKVEGHLIVIPKEQGFRQGETLISSTYLNESLTLTPSKRSLQVSTLSTQHILNVNQHLLTHVPLHAFNTPPLVTYYINN